MQKQAGKSIQRHKSLKKNLSQESSASSILFEGGETPLQFIIPPALLPKNRNLFCEGKEGLKKGRGEKGNSVTTSL
jgi:hypothetical protein